MNILTPANNGYSDDVLNIAKTRLTNAQINVRMHEITEHRHYALLARNR